LTVRRLDLVRGSARRQFENFVEGCFRHLAALPSHPGFSTSPHEARKPLFHSIASPSNFRFDRLPRCAMHITRGPTQSQPLPNSSTDGVALGHAIVSAVATSCTGHLLVVFVPCGLCQLVLVLAVP
jgi:hypothetical protein